MSRTADTAGSEPPEAAATTKRVYVKQADIPAVGLDEALRIAETISEQYGTRPPDVALALNLLPKGSQFEALAGAAMAYGLTEGGSQAEIISLTDLGRRIVAPLEEGDDLIAKREAFLTPRIPREFLERYDGSGLPTDERISKNMLDSLGVPTKRTAATLEMVVGTAEALGLLGDVRGKKVVNLSPASRQLHAVPELADDTAETDETEDNEDAVLDPAADAAGAEIVPPLTSVPDLPSAPERNRKVFVTHGSNKKIVEQIESVLEYGDLEPVISIKRETTAKPVPKKVFDDMNECGAGIIHVAKEKTLIDSDGNEHHVLNENVLIEIGGAMALWGDNFILLVEEGTTLPSNLQGLYEVRYEGTALDGDATMKLLNALKSFKS